MTRVGKNMTRIPALMLYSYYTVPGKKQRCPNEAGKRPHWGLSVTSTVSRAGDARFWRVLIRLKTERPIFSISKRTQETATIQWINSPLCWRPYYFDLFGRWGQPPPRPPGAPENPVGGKLSTGENEQQETVSPVRDTESF